MITIIDLNNYTNEKIWYRATIETDLFPTFEYVDHKKVHYADLEKELPYTASELKRTFHTIDFSIINIAAETQKYSIHIEWYVKTDKGEVLLKIISPQKNSGYNHENLLKPNENNIIAPMFKFQ